MSTSASTEALPPHELKESPNSHHLTQTLGIPLPEMTFGDNVLVLHHEPSQFKYCFTTERSIAGVKNGELEDADGPVKVGYADAWLKSRVGENAASPMPKTVATKPYDWTYTTMYGGHIAKINPDHDPVDDSSKFSEQSWVSAVEDHPAHQIPYEELKKNDPILFYSEIPLFEDELHDNGSSNHLVRIRVMPTCIFILCRYTLRVDNVLFRTFDTRIYHSFDSKILIRETSGWEAPYDTVKQHLPTRYDLTPLTDPGFIANILTNTLSPSLTQQRGAGTKWRGMGKKVEVLTFR
ncbi:type 2A phosphatase activator TIP41 [Flagelloscypha sp. PMI_526]|nr:type 2A phosphatase activator TIP41 [Flagelloscypha sp. PMI_526]